MTLLHREHQRSPSVPNRGAPTRLSACAPLSQRVHMESDSPRSAVRRQVRAERERHGWSQTDLAKAAGVSRGSIANLEGGSRLTEGKESKIEAALDKPLGWLDSLRSGLAAAALVDTREPTVDDRSDAPINPVTEYRMELDYFYDRLKDNPSDFVRLRRLLDLAVQLESDTQSSTRAEAQGYP